MKKKTITLSGLIVLIGVLSIVVTLAIVVMREFDGGQTICAPTLGTYSARPVAEFDTRFVILGDFGSDNEHEQEVANHILSWQPEFIVTVGDNNYSGSTFENFDKNIGQYYHAFIGDYKGSYGEGAASNNFYPIVGNHDWDNDSLAVYMDYFSLPGNERYYDFVRGPIHFFILSADDREPDGTDAQSIQAQWLKAGLAASTAPYQLVFTHFPPYSSSKHGSTEYMQWPFAEWGADAVFSGHDHSYERLSYDGIWHVINGLGGKSPHHKFQDVLLEQSIVQHNCDYGALVVDANADQIQFQFVTIQGEIIDQYVIKAALAGG